METLLFEDLRLDQALFGRLDHSAEGFDCGFRIDWIVSLLLASGLVALAGGRRKFKKK
jgi:hypothetical protein